MGGLVGNFIKLHPKTERVQRLDTARVLVEVDLHNKWPYTINLLFDGTKYKIDVSFPWLPPQCGHYFKWGHIRENCVSRKSQASVSDPNSKTTKDVLIPRKRDKAEA